MTTTTEAMWTGIKRGAKIAVTADPTRLRALSQEALSSTVIEDAWLEVGQDLRAAMEATGATRCSCSHLPR